MPNSTNILICVQNAAFARALAGAIDQFEFCRAVGVVLDASTLLSRLNRLNVHIVVLDIESLDGLGQKLLQTLGEKHPEIKVLQVGGWRPDEDSTDAIFSPSNVMPRDASVDEWEQALRRLSRGEESDPRPAAEPAQPPKRKLAARSPRLPKRIAALPLPKVSTLRAPTLLSHLPERRHLVVYLFFLVLNLVAAAIFLTNTASGTESAWDGLPLDDGWIHFVYARNLADYGWFYYNPGVPEAGFTSPLWAIVLAIPFKLLLPFGVSPVLIAKGVGVALAVVASAAAYHLVRRYTSNGPISILAGTIIAVDPTLSFGKVSGMEIVLFSSLILLSMLFFSQERFRAAGVAAGLMGLARPEGYLLVLMMFGCILIRFSQWVADPKMKTENPLRSVWRMLIPVVLLLVPMLMVYSVINGSPYPNTYHAKRQNMGIFNLENLSAVWTGYANHIAFFGHTLWVVGAVLLIVGMLAAVRRKGLSSLPLVVAPWAMFYALSVIMPLNQGSWKFYLRRYLDPTIPVMAVLLAIAIWQLTVLLDRSRLATLKAPWKSPIVLSGKLIIVVACLVPWAFEAAPLWQQYPGEFSWNTRNINDVNVFLGKWAKENLPSDVRIALSDAGALRYFGPGKMLDIRGLNSHEILQHNAFEVMKEQSVDYVITFPGMTIDGWPYARRIYEVNAGNNTILEAGVMAVYKTDWNPPLADKAGLFQLQTQGWEVIDSLDAGDAEDEARHSYEVTDGKPVVQRLFKEADGIVVSDEGEVYTGRESFTVASRPRTDLRIAKRYDAFVRGRVQVYANDAFVGDWAFAGSSFQFGEDSFVIPSSFITGDRTRLSFEFVPGSAWDINSFYYWVLVRRPTN